MCGGYATSRDFATVLKAKIDHHQISQVRWVGSKTSFMASREVVATSSLEPSRKAKTH